MTEKSPTRFAPQLLCLAIFAIYWKRLFFDNTVPCDGSTLRLVYPSWVIVRNALTHFDSLLWDPLRNMGQPLLAMPPTEVLYPLQWISPLVDFISYSKIFVAVHTMLVLVYGFKLFRHFYTDELTSWLGAIALAFNGLMFNKAVVHADFAAMCWIAACLYYLVRRQPVALGVCVALQWLAGLPTYSILTGLIMTALALISDDRRAALRTMILGVTAGIGLSAIQWIPFLECLHQSKRGVFLANAMATDFSLHPLELLRGISLPSLIGTRIAGVSGSDPAVIGFFVGPVLFGLFLFGLWRLPRFEKKIGALTVVTMLLALGHYIGVYQYIPFITVFRFPALWMVPATLGVVWVAAAGFRQVQSLLIKRVVFAAVAIDLLVYSFTPLIGYADATFVTSTSLRPQALKEIPAGTRLFHSWSITNTIHTWQIRNMDDWYLLKGLLAPSIATAYGVSEVESCTQLISARHVKFLVRLNEAPMESALFSEARVSKMISVAPLSLNKPIPEKADVKVIERTDWKPRMYMETGAAVEIVRDQAGHFEAVANGPGRLVVAESFYPSWKARVDGTLQAVQPFDETFLSLEIPAGQHRVELRYRPVSFYMGLGVSLTTLIALLLWRRRSRS